MPSIVDLAHKLQFKLTGKQPIEYRREPASVLSNEQRLSWEDNGFLVISKLFPANVTDEINRTIDECWEQSRTSPSEVVIDIEVTTDPNNPEWRPVKLHDAPAESRNASYKMNDLYLTSPVIRNLVLDAKLTEILAELLGAPPLLCNTLSVERGTKSKFHTDSLYMTPVSELNLVAAWIALQDCQPEAGLLGYYPGSHKIPPHSFSTGGMHFVPEEMPNYREYMEQEIQRRGLEVQHFCPSVGDVLIWHSQLYHGGAQIEDSSLNRKSLIAHYYRARDIPALHGRVGTGRYYLVRPPKAV